MKVETLNIDLLEAMQIEYSAEFVPFSQSRNKDNKDKSLNWTVTLKRHNVTLTTDYMQGIAHHPFYKQTWGKLSKEQQMKQMAIEHSAENGSLYRFFGNLYNNYLPAYIKRKDRKEGESLRTQRLPKPDLKDVLHSLILDSNVLQHDSFESWAGEFGYDEDSREAKKIYQACLKIALKINQMFTTEEREQLQEFYQDY